MNFHWNILMNVLQEYVTICLFCFVVVKHWCTCLSILPCRTCLRACVKFPSSIHIRISVSNSRPNLPRLPKKAGSRKTEIPFRNSNPQNGSYQLGWFFQQPRLPRERRTTSSDSRPRPRCMPSPAMMSPLPFEKEKGRWSFRRPVARGWLLPAR